MAVAHNGTDSTGNTGAGALAVSSLAWSHTVNSSLANSILMIGVAWDDGGNGNSISSITYGAQNATFVSSKITTVNNVTVEIWRLIAPIAGTANITINWTGNINAAGGGAVFTGVDQLSPLNAAATNAGSTTPITVSKTGVSTNNIMFNTAIAYAVTGLTLTNGAGGQTQAWNSKTTNAGSQVYSVAAYKTSAVGSVTTTWTESVNKEWASIIVELKQVAAVVNIDSWDSGQNEPYFRKTEIVGY